MIIPNISMTSPSIFGPNSSAPPPNPNNFASPSSSVPKLKSLIERILTTQPNQINKMRQATTLLGFSNPFLGFDENGVTYPELYQIDEIVKKCAQDLASASTNPDEQKLLTSTLASFDTLYDFDEFKENLLSDDPKMAVIRLRCRPNNAEHHYITMALTPRTQDNAPHKLWLCDSANITGNYKGYVITDPTQLAKTLEQDIGVGLPDNQESIRAFIFGDQALQGTQTDETLTPPTTRKSQKKGNCGPASIKAALKLGLFSQAKALNLAPAVAERTYKQITTAMRIEGSKRLNAMSDQLSPLTVGQLKGYLEDKIEQRPELQTELDRLNEKCPGMSAIKFVTSPTPSASRLSARLQPTLQTRPGINLDNINSLFTR